jgi:transcriptional regulator of acetoin/glycerol metabolism
MMAAHDTIDVRDLPEHMQVSHSSPSLAEEDGLLSMEEVERRHLYRVLEQVGGNRGRAAEVLGISRTTLYRLLERDKRVSSASEADTSDQTQQAAS